MATFCKWSALVWTAVIGLFFVIGICRMLALAHDQGESGLVMLVGIMIAGIGYGIIWSIVAVPALFVWFLTRRH